MGISTAILGAGVLGAGSSILGSSQQAGSARKSQSFQNDVYNTEQKNLAPYLGTGQGALGQLAGLYGLPGAPPGAAGGAAQAFQNFTQTPAYQFPLQQENLALSRSLGARGLAALSGAQLMDSANLNAGYASQGFQGYINQLQQLAGMGQNAAVNQGGLGANLAGPNFAANQMGGNAGAAGIMGATNSINGSLSNLLPYLNGNNTGSSFQGVGNGTLSNYVDNGPTATSFAPNVTTASF